jgi:hypothetical protein
VVVHVNGLPVVVHVNGLPVMYGPAGDWFCIVGYNDDSICGQYVSTQDQVTGCCGNCCCAAAIGVVLLIQMMEQALKKYMHMVKAR